MKNRLMRARPSTSFPFYDHLNPGGVRSPLTVIWIQGLPGMWTESEPSLREFAATTAATSSCVAAAAVGNVTELCRDGTSAASDVWELRAPGEAGEHAGPPYPTWALVLMGLLAGCMSLVTVSGNLIVILSFFIERTIRQPTNYFIASLAVSDLLIGSVSMPFYTVYLLTGQHWPLGEILCDLWLSVDYTVCLCSIYTVFCITIDRFCSVRIPAKYRNWRTERKVLAVVALTWVVPALVFFPSVFGWQCFVGQRTVPPGKCYVQYMEDALFNCFLQVGYFWVTLCAMCGLYGGIYRVALNLQQKSDLKQRRTTKLATTTTGGQTMTRCTAGSGVIGDDDRPSRREEAPGNDTYTRGRRGVNNGGCDRSSRGKGDSGGGGSGSGGGGGGGVINGREEEREDSLSSPDYPGIVYLDEKPDGQHLSASFIHHVDGRAASTAAEEEEDREKERQRKQERKRNDEGGGAGGGGRKRGGGGGTKNSGDVAPVPSAQNQRRENSRDGKSSSRSNTLRRSDDGNRSSPNLFSGRPPARKTRKAVFIERSTDYDAPSINAEADYPAAATGTAYFEVRWLSEDDLESRLFEENVRLLVRSHRIDSSATDSAGEEPGSPVWKKRGDDDGTPPTPMTEHSSLLVSMNDGRSTTAIQYQSTVQQEPAEGTERRRVRRKDGSHPPSNQSSAILPPGANGFDARKDAKGYRRVFARIREWREGSGRHRLSIDGDQTPSPPPLPLSNSPTPPPPPPLSDSLPRLRHVLNNGDIELKHLDGREGMTAPCPTATDGQRGSDLPCTDQTVLRGAQEGTSAAAAAPFQSVLRRLRKFDDSRNRESSSNGGEEAAGRKCKRVNRARKALRTITVILGAFVLCWTPWHVLSMIIGFCPRDVVCVAPVLYDISYWLCYLNSPLNPFCYALANQQFKKTFARILKFDWHRT